MVCKIVLVKSLLLFYLLVSIYDQSAGNREKTAHRLRRQIIKGGQCPLWTTIRNCSTLEQCNWDVDCSGAQRCCKSTCETRSCHEPILPIRPNEDACPKDEATMASNKENSDCRLTRTRFCFKRNCKRCCFHHSTCNPHRELLMSREACQKVLCSRRKCEYPGEVCRLDRYDSPRCSCQSKCPTPRPEESVCGTDGIPYKSYCELNRTACILGAKDITIYHYGSCKPNGVRLKVSSAHKSRQVLPAYEKGELRCRFDGDPLSITWKKVGLRGLPNRMIPEMDKLNIQDVDMRDGGMYKCQAYDGFLTVEAEISVIVNGPTPASNRSSMSRADCLQPRSTGYCKRHGVRWYFDGKDGVCRSFAYGGCGGNTNNFETQEACNSACSHAAGDICSLPKVEGLCKGFIPQWFYNSDIGRCEQFVYGGCGGNANKFNTKAACLMRCAANPSANTPCLRRQFEARRNKRLGVFVPRCLSDGRYAGVQCHGSICFCMDEEGDEVSGTRVSRHLPLNCTGTNQLPPVGDSTPCQKAQRKNSVVPFGSYLVRCKQDGSYEEVQCNGSSGFCWCVQKNGTELSGTKTRGPLLCPTLDIRLTHCQKKFLDNSRSLQPNVEIPRCRRDGKFQEVQCRGEMCYCVDADSGREVRDTEINTLVGEPRCGDAGRGLTRCQRMHREALRSLTMNTRVPQCKFDGSFEEIQCHGLSDECWCVDHQGIEIAGTRRMGPLQCAGVGKPLAPCQIEYQKYLRRSWQSFNRYAPRCSPDGAYEKVQCSGGVCYCVTPQGKEIPGTKTINLARQPNCTHTDANITPCERKRRDSIHYSKKFVPFCKPDGSWSEIQCELSSGSCWCVDSKGHEIIGSRSTSLKSCPNFDKLSPCRKRLVYWLKNPHPDEHLPWCRADGSFNHMQCYGSHCYCVNEKGNEIPGTKISVSAGRPVCTFSEGRVTSCQRKYREALLQSFRPTLVPRCKLDGRYEEVQCQGSTKECWCVNHDGNERPGTRTTKPLKCPIIGAQLSKCQRRYREYAKNPIPGQLIPRCRNDGSFESVQCRNLDCYCVDENGDPIAGTSLPARLGKPKCRLPGEDPLSSCQKQHKAALRFPATPSRFIPACKRDGRFEEIQCLRATGECWCVDASGKEMKGTRTAGYIICPSSAASLTSCQMEYQERLRNWLLPGPYIPQCSHQGQYEPMQCYESYCFCVNEHGVELVGSRVDKTEGKPNCNDGVSTLTVCQKQLQDYLRNPMPDGFEPHCSKTGAFQEIQCHGPFCFCVKRDGIEVPGTRQILVMGKPVCSKQGFSLTRCHKQLQEAINHSQDPDKFLPRCKYDGSYEEIQCHKATGKCWCVDRDGNTLPSTATNKNVTCPFTTDTKSSCWSRYQQNVRSSPAGSHIPWCKADGSFIPFQVQASQFFCVNRRGEELPGMSVDISLGKPDCRAATTHGFIATPCQLERARRTHLSSYVPRCRVDGTYDEVQCDVNDGQCWCVDRDGREINATRGEGVIRCPTKESLTLCQKRQKEAIKRSSNGPNIWNFVPRCRQDGGFHEVQCHVGTGQCWCVDKNGNERFGTVARGLPNCSGKFTTCQRQRARALGLAGNPLPGAYVPHCKPDGSYNDVQCHAYIGLCWCVDEKGDEILGTKKWGRLSCVRSSSDNSNPIDLGILIDSSDSVAKKYLPKMLEFVSTIVDSFDISAGGTHVGLIVFSRDAEIPLYFNTLQGNNLTADNVKKFVSNLKYMEGWSRFDLAMSVAEDELFSGASGMRNGIPKILLVLTSSTQERNQGPTTPLSAASQGLRDRDVSIYVIGVGDKIEVPELLDLASDYRNVFVTSNFNTLLSSGVEVTAIMRNGTEAVSRNRICNLPSEPGQLGCLASINAHYFEASLGECQKFIYSGCGGNANNFPTYKKCMDNCKDVLPSCLAEQRRVFGLQVGHFVPKCKLNGRYESMQCYRKTGFCWCVDEYGKELHGTRVKGTPICSMADASRKLTPCLEERRKALGFSGVPSIGKFVPECNPDGEYAEVQCFGNTNFCWCSDKRGYEIHGTHRWGTPKCPSRVHRGICPFVSDPKKCPAEMSEQTCSQDSDCSESSKCCYCGCVRRCTPILSDEPEVSDCALENEKSLSAACSHVQVSGRFHPKCKVDGSYEGSQCLKSSGVCWCVDRDGNEIPGTRQTGKPNCTMPVSLTPCQKENKRAVTMRSRTVVGLIVPRCLSDGLFDPVQCNNNTGFCWCVDKHGSELVGTRQWGRPNCTDIDKRVTVCTSRREECLDNAPRGHFVPRCKADGSFDDVQCLQATGECWCVDTNGEEIPGTRSIGKLDCSVIAWLSPCQIQRRQALGLKSVPTVGVYVPECKADGGFEAVQCNMAAGYCWCVDDSGTEVKGSKVRGRPRCGKEKLCKKRFDEILSSFPATPLGLFVPKCLDDGGYRAIQCHNSTGYCWCVDDFGNELAGTRVRGQQNCSASTDQKFTLCQSRYNHASEINERGRPVPLCKTDGSFKTTQCNSVTGECWCVDVEGNEKPETRKVGDPNCESKDVETNCQLLPDPGPCEVFEPSWFFNKTSGVCAVFTYGGCKGNANRFTSYDECQADCHGRNLTFCELQREINTASSNGFIPRCKDNGDFEPLQCQRTLGECWCVDESGIELPDSRTDGSPDCSGIDAVGGRRNR